MGTSLLWMEIQVGVAVLVILLLRQGMKKLPKFYAHVLWLLVFVRLLCPVTLESRFGFLPSEEEGNAWVERLQHAAGTRDQENGLLPVGQRGMAGEESGWTNGGWNHLAGMGKDLAGAREFPGIVGFQGMEEEQGAGALPGKGFLQGKAPEDGAARPGEGAAGVLFGIWMLGFLGILGWNGMELLQVRRKLEKAMHQGGNVYISDRISAPFTLGLVRPRIYLPAGLGQARQAYILCHEQVHIRRRDYLVKNLAFLLTAMHWYNPFVWTAFFFLGRDMEMSCDEKVIRLMGVDIKRSYSQSLLDFATGKQGMALTPLTFGANGVKQRVKNVLSYQKTKRLGVLSGILVLVLAGGMLFTTRVQGEENPASGSDTGQTQGALLGKDGEEADTDRGRMEADQETDSATEAGQDAGSGVRNWQELTDCQESAGKVLDRWAQAFVDRDGETLLALAHDKERFLTWDMVGGQRAGEITFGQSSPWPWNSGYAVYYQEGSGSAIIRYYMDTSVPEIYIVDETVDLVREGDLYYVEHQKLAEYYTIENKEQFEALYGQEGAYDFGWENTGYSTFFYQALFRHLAEGTNPEAYKAYTDPVTAAVCLLHLGAGEGKVRLVPAKAEEEEPWRKLLQQNSREGSQAVVSYTFSQDGTTVEIPMELVEGSTGLWAIGDSGMVRQVYRTVEETDSAVAEYFGWAAKEPFYIQTSQYGIYRVDRDNELTCIYPHYVAPDTIWTLQDGLMYFWVDSRYQEGDLDYDPDTIGILDVRTGEFDGETLRVPEEVRGGLLPARWISVYGGFLHLYGEEESYAMPLINTGATNLTAGPMWKGFPVAGLKEGGQDAYGRDVRQRLLGHPGRLLELGNRAMTETYTYVDLDGDGRAEKITLSRNPDVEEIREGPYDNYLFQAGESQVTGSVENLYNGIWACSLDGKEILLALYEDGPSGDPRTTLYAYREGELVSVGSFGADIRSCILEKGRICGTQRQDVLQTDWVETVWQVGRDGRLEQVIQETYDFCSLNEIRLLTELPVHEKPADTSPVRVVLKPQKVRFLKTDDTFQWIYVEGEDKRGGWFRVDPGGVELPGMGLDYMEVFEGLNMVD